MFSNCCWLLQVMQKCFGVFNAWDEEYDKFTGQLREMIKKKREETLKFAWRANPAHKKLQDRITIMREYVNLCIYLCATLHHMFVMRCVCISRTLSFRKQHEQLQAVIVRVLRPQQQKGQAAQVYNRCSVRVCGTCCMLVMHPVFHAINI